MRSTKPSRIPNLLLGLLLGCLGIFSLEIKATEKGVPVVSVFDSKELGTGIPVRDFAQDASGVLHAAGAGGLLHYDGQRWTFTKMGDSRTLASIDFDVTGKKLWAGSKGELGWFESSESESKWVYHSLREFLPPEHQRLTQIWSVFSEGKGAVFVSEDKILRWDGTMFRVWSLPGALSLPANLVEGRIYVHHLPTGIYELGPDGPVNIIPREICGDLHFLWMEREGDGWLLGANYGFFRFRDNHFELFAEEASAYMVSHGGFSRALRLPDGRLAVGTGTGGLMLLRPDGAIDAILERGQGLPDTAVWALFLDREGGLWVSSRSRVYRLSLDSASGLFGASAGLNTYQIDKIVRHEGKIIVATDSGVYSLSPETSRFSKITELRGSVADMRSVSDGLLFAGNYIAGLWKGGRIQRLRQPVKIPILVLPSRTLPGRILVSAGDVILAVDRAGNSRILVKNLPAAQTSLAEDAAGRLWMSSASNGVLLARPQAEGAVEAVPPSAEFGLPVSKGYSRFVETDDGTLLAFGDSTGSILLPGAERFVPIDHYPQRTIRGFSYVPEQKSVWVIHNETAGRGAGLVARIALKEGGAVWEPHQIAGLPSLGVMQTIFAESTGDGATTLWIAGNGQILRQEVRGGLVTPVLVAPQLRVYAGDAANNASMKEFSRPLPYLTKSVRFDFSVRDFSRRDSLRFETFIEGVDQDWVTADASGRRELTALRDGDYTFRVRTLAETGAASEPVEFKFEVMPPWWRTAPAMMSLAVALVPLGYGILRMRLGALKRRTKELEEKVRERTEQLAQASAAKTQFVANMSHDIRNPLNGIVGLALALDDTRLDARQREIVATLRECTGYLSTLVDDVLDFAQIEAGKIELRPEPFVAEELLQSVATTLKSDATEVGANLLVETDADVPHTLVADAGRIQQILVNYVGNALKYSGGTIRLSVRLAPDTVDEVEFAVADNGPGLTEAEQSVLFTQFTRLEGARKEGIAGTGLGLAACRSLADLMGGSVGVESTLGHGARFYLRLPLATATEPVVSSNAPALLPKATVLVVEDADYNAWAAAAVLSKLGLPHARACTGAEALEMMAKQSFDVVLLDRNLPDMDGTEVAKRIREMEGEGPRAVLLAVTAYCTAADKALCLASGMDAFVGKPLTPHKLRRVLLAAGQRLLASAPVEVAPEVISKAPGQLDMTLLRYLSDGTEAGLDAQIDRFLGPLAEAELALARAAGSRDFVTIGAVAHQVLSQARMVACAALEDAASRLEQAALKNDERVWGELWRRVTAEMETLRATLRDRKPLTA